MASELFSGVTLDPERFRSDMRESAARSDYAIFFTPRSGSSWLTDVLSRSGLLGRPEEWFNPDFVPRVAQNLNAANLPDYVGILRRKVAPGDIFGFETTYYQLMSTFGDEESFLEFFPSGTPAFFLVREDIVSQAVSLAKSVATSVYHSAEAAAEDISKADSAFEYDARTIRRWLEHILDQELRLERFFAIHGIAPVRLSYERLTAAGAARALELFATRLGVSAEAAAGAEGLHRKIGTDKNRQFAAPFASEHPDFVQVVTEQRATTIGALGRAEAEAVAPRRPGGN